MMAIIMMDGAAKKDMRALLIRNKTGNVKAEDGSGGILGFGILA